MKRSTFRRKPGIDPLWGVEILYGPGLVLIDEARWWRFRLWNGLILYTGNSVHFLEVRSG